MNSPGAWCQIPPPARIPPTTTPAPSTTAPPPANGAPQAAPKPAATPSFTPESEQIIGIALGNYNPESTEQYFKAQKLPTTSKRGYTLYAFGTGTGANDLFFFFIDANKAAFGHKHLLEQLIEIRYGAEEGLLRNDTMYSLISEANGSGMIWAVLDPAYTRLAMSQLAPEVQQFPDAAKLINRMQSMIISASSSGGIDSKFQAVCGSVDDANTLAQLMTAGLLYKKYQASKDTPELAALLDQATVSPSGDRVVIHVTVSDDQMTSMIRKNVFAFKM